MSQGVMVGLLVKEREKHKKDIFIMSACLKRRHTFKSGLRKGQCQ